MHGGDITVHVRFNRTWKSNSRGGNWIKEAQTACVLGCQHGVVVYAFIYGLVNVEKWKSDGYFSVKRPRILLVDPKDIWSFSRLQNWVCEVRHVQVRCYSNLSDQAYVLTTDGNWPDMLIKFLDVQPKLIWYFSGKKFFWWCSLNVACERVFKLYRSMATELHRTLRSPQRFCVLD